MRKSFFTAPHFPDELLREECRLELWKIGRMSLIDVRVRLSDDPIIILVRAIREKIRTQQEMHRAIDGFDEPEPRFGQQEFDKFLLIPDNDLIFTIDGPVPPPDVPLVARRTP